MLYNPARPRAIPCLCCMLRPCLSTDVMLFMMLAFVTLYVGPNCR